MGTAWFGRTFVVTGAASGIGRRVAEDLARQGALVHTWDLQSTADPVDVADFAQVRRAAQRVSGRLDGLVLCAGGNIQDAMRANFVGSVLPLQELTPALQRAAGAAVLVSSVATLGYQQEGSEEYVGSKGAIEALTRYYARKLQPYVRVNCVRLGPIRTPRVLRDLGPILKDIEEAMPLRCLGDIEDAADAILFLLRNRYITGEVLNVTGGL